jgi:hypothetical protein
MRPVAKARATGRTVTARAGPSALGGWLPGGDRGPVALFFRAIETHDGDWACRHGLIVYDEHPTLAQALEHLRELAQAYGAAEFFAHWKDGHISREGAVGPEA